MVVVNMANMIMIGYILAVVVVESVVVPVGYFDGLW